MKQKEDLEIKMEIRKAIEEFNKDGDGKKFYSFIESMDISESPEHFMYLLEIIREEY